MLFSNSILKVFDNAQLMQLAYFLGRIQVRSRWPTEMSIEFPALRGLCK